MLKEKDLYEPVRLALQEKFKTKGICYLEVTANKISEKIKQVLDDQAVFILGTEKIIPDIMGYVTIEHQYGHKEKRLIVAEVKRDLLTFDNVYQVKKYVEMLNAYYTFLVSPQGFSEAHRRFIKNRSLLTCFGYKNIIVMRLIDEKFLEQDKELCYFDPFAPEHDNLEKF